MTSPGPRRSRLPTVSTISKNARANSASNDSSTMPCTTHSCSPDFARAPEAPVRPSRCPTALPRPSRLRRRGPRRRERERQRELLVASSPPRRQLWWTGQPGRFGWGIVGTPLFRFRPTWPRCCRPRVWNGGRWRTVGRCPLVRPRYAPELSWII